MSCWSAQTGWAKTCWVGNVFKKHFEGARGRPFLGQVTPAREGDNAPAQVGSRDCDPNDSGCVPNASDVGCHGGEATAPLSRDRGCHRRRRLGPRQRRQPQGVRRQSFGRRGPGSCGSGAGNRQVHRVAVHHYVAA
jgi:hypothetical protein